MYGYFTHELNDLATISKITNIAKTTKISLYAYTKEANILALSVGITFCNHFITHAVMNITKLAVELTIQICRAFKTFSRHKYSA